MRTAPTLRSSSPRPRLVPEGGRGGGSATPHRAEQWCRHEGTSNPALAHARPGGTQATVAEWVRAVVAARREAAGSDSCCDSSEEEHAHTPQDLPDGGGPAAAAASLTSDEEDCTRARTKRRRLGDEGAAATPTAAAAALAAALREGGGADGVCPGLEGVGVFALVACLNHNCEPNIAVCARHSSFAIVPRIYRLA